MAILPTHKQAKHYVNAPDEASDEEADAGPIE